MFTERERKEEELTTSMSTRSAGTSPLVYARLAGLLVLVLVVISPFSLIYIPSTLVVPGDATATANNVMASDGLFRLGIISDAAIFLIDIVVTALLYLLPYFIALLLLSGAGYLTVFDPDQLNALVLLSLNAHENAVYIWQAFFGLSLFVLGYLIFESGYFPRILGILMVVGALGYLIDSFGNILLPSYGEVFGLVVAVTAIIGELPFFVWLLVKGVNVQKWHDRASSSS